MHASIRDDRLGPPRWSDKGRQLSVSDVVWGKARGQAIFRALAEVSPDVIRTLHDATKAPN